MNGAASGDTGEQDSSRDNTGDTTRSAGGIMLGSKNCQSNSGDQGQNTGISQSNSRDLTNSGNKKLTTGTRQSRLGDLLTSGREISIRSGCEASGDKENGFKAPRLADGSRVDGTNKRVLRRENKCQRKRRQAEQPALSYWRRHEGLAQEPIEPIGSGIIE